MSVRFVPGRVRSPRPALAILLAAGMLAPAPAVAGTTGPSFDNWTINFGNNNSGNQVNNVQINLGSNINTVNQISQTILYDNGHPVPGFGGGQIAQVGNNYILNWNVPAGANIPANGNGLHVGVGFNGGVVGHPGNLNEMTANASGGAGGPVNLALPALNPMVTSVGGNPANLHPVLLNFEGQANGLILDDWAAFLVPVGAALTFLFVNPDTDDGGHFDRVGPPGFPGSPGADGDDFPVSLNFASYAFPSTMPPLSDLMAGNTFDWKPLLPGSVVVPPEGSVSVSVLPEPSTLLIALSGMGAIGLFRFARRRR